MAKKTTDLKYYEAVGRRKEAVARVRLYLVTNKEDKVKVGDNQIKKGEIYINQKPLEKIYFDKAQREKLLFPLKLTQQENRFAISVYVKGGGKEGQLEAIIHGISRALLLTDEQLKPILKQYHLLTRDPRMKERRKVGTGGKARRKKQSPKR